MDKSCLSRLRDERQRAAARFNNRRDIAAGYIDAIPSNLVISADCLFIRSWRDRSGGLFLEKIVAAAPSRLLFPAVPRRERAPRGCTLSDPRLRARID